MFDLHDAALGATRRLLATLVTIAVMLLKHALSRGASCTTSTLEDVVEARALALQQRTCAYVLTALQVAQIV